jgi:NAD(P)-dependent dehydrogenase (short-subunit alcohol dehydrogenase family)
VNEILSSRRLVGRRALVTGAAGGMGRAVARRFAAEGARVALTDLATEPLERIVAELREVGAGAVAYPADVVDEEQVAAAVDAVAEAFGGIDVLYNNAGVRLVGQDGPVDRLDRAVWDATFAVNATGAFLFCKHALPHLLRSPAGVILNVSSTAGSGGDSEAHAYGASKGALIALTKGIAQRFGRAGLRANVICPGLIETRMLDAALEREELTQALLAQVALGRVGRPEEVAAYAAFLASDEASYVTASVIEIHGGLVK